MSHFKTLICCFIFLSGQTSYANRVQKTCAKAHSEARDFCYKDTHSKVKTVDVADDEEALVALKFVQDSQRSCYELIDQCKKSCQFESKSTDSNDIRAFHFLINCESGDISRAHYERVSDRTAAERIASQRGLDAHSTGKENRSSSPGTAMTTLPGLVGSVGVR